MNYYYNEKEKAFAITTNFSYNPIPNGYREITKEEYDRLQEEYERLQEELNAQNEDKTE